MKQIARGKQGKKNKKEEDNQPKTKHNVNEIE